MGRKKNKNGQGEEGKDVDGNASKIRWTNELVHVLLDLCIKHTLISKGKSGAITSHQLVWNDIISGFEKETKLAWDKNRLKNKLDSLRPKWTLWKQLKTKETGLGWNNDKGVVYASDEWWSIKIKVSL